MAKPTRFFLQITGILFSSAFVALFAASTAWAQSANPTLGFQKRHGDEIVVCGQLYRIGTPVKLWTDQGGYDAYRTERRFSSLETRSWSKTVEAMKDGKINFVTSPQEVHPDRYSLRYERNAETEFTPEQLEQIRGGGWDLPLLQDKVDQFVLHYDVCGTAAQCFYVLHDMRGLSVHFMLDADGTIYQTLDLKERAWHATKSNDRSIGIEIANIGAYRVGARENTLTNWYRKDDRGNVELIFPANVRGQAAFAGKTLRPRKPEPVRGFLHGSEYEQYDFTPEQYDALIKLTAALTDIFPKMNADAPRTPEGKVFDTTLSDEQWASFSGVLGHYHVQRNKTDPGTAFDWEYFLGEVKKQKAKIEAAR